MQTKKQNSSAAFWDQLHNPVKLDKLDKLPDSDKLTAEREKALGLLSLLAKMADAGAIPPECRNPKAVDPKLKAVVDTVTQTCGQPIDELVLSLTMCPVGMASGTDFDDGDKTMIIVSPGIRLFMPDEHIGAAAAHELGHLRYRDSRAMKQFFESEFGSIDDLGVPHVLERMTPKQFAAYTHLSHESEYRADAFATDYGYGPALVVSLNTDYGVGGIVHGYSASHPTTDERVQRIQQRMDSKISPKIAPLKPR